MIARFLRYDGKGECHQIEPEWVSDILAAVKGQYFFARYEFSINGADYAKVDILYENDGEKHIKFDLDGNIISRPSKNKSKK